MIHQPFVVLLCEDDRDDEQIALRALLRCGLPLMVRVARNGELALRVLGLEGGPEGRHREAPDLVISDLKMPKLDGSEVLRRARAYDELKDIPFVIFSSSDEPRDIEECMGLGATEYVTKPVDFERYIDCVRAIAWRWLAAARVGAGAATEARRVS